MVNFSGTSSRPILALVGLVIVAGAGAYYYYVYLPETESKPVKAVQAPVKRPMIAKPSPAQTQPAASAVPATAVASEPVAAPLQLASNPPQMSTPEQKPESVQSEPVVKKPATKKPKVKSRPVRPTKVSKPSAPPKSQQITPPVPLMVPEPVLDTAEPIIPTPKYNDILTAVLRGDRDAVRQLLDLGRWVDKPGESGLTPLMAAIMNRDTPMAQLLLDNGAKPTAQSIELARKHKDAAIVSLLEQHSER